MEFCIYSIQDELSEIVNFGEIGFGGLNIGGYHTHTYIY